MPNLTMHDIMPNYKFVVFVGALKMCFSKITNIEYEVEEEIIQEGGLNGFVHIAASPCKNPHTVVFEKGVSSNASENKSNSRLMMAGLGLKPGTRLHDDICIFVLDNSGTIKKTYCLERPYVKKWSMGDLDATSSNVMIERFEVSCAKVVCTL